MEKLDFSILVCAYGNPAQFSNFLWTAYCQDYPDNYEIVVVDNATPGAQIENTCRACPGKVRKRINYIFLRPKDKRCKNIAQGINLAARKAKGKYLVIVADSNVLLSFNLLESIADFIDDGAVVLSAGCNDVKISPDGSYDTEYAKQSAGAMAEANERLLEEMGWPCDPLHLRMVAGKHRYPPPHLTYDCYIVALSKENFFKFGGYDENQRSWGEYHQKFVSRMVSHLQQRNLVGVKIVHQFHRVYKNDPL